MRHLFLLCLLLALFPSLCIASRGISLDVSKPGGGMEQIPLYKDSHALLIGVSDYTAGWPDLESIPSEMALLESSLKSQGFNVEKVLSPSSDQMVQAFDGFIDRYGFDPDNRLLFFFSGHGYSRMNGKKGYIVPADAPDPRVDERGFLRKSVEMKQLLTWAERIESTHALFLFDSCFSGTVFKSRALPKEPPHISAMIARPVRQFITAGSAGEEVPASSVFVPSFLRAIEGEGDLDQDGYVTGTELGMYLNRHVTGYRVGQTPQFGKIRNPDLDQGDFVFVLSVTTATDEQKQENSRASEETDLDALFWQSVQTSTNPASFEAYLNQFPAGSFAVLARLRLNELRELKKKDASIFADAGKLKTKSTEKNLSSAETNLDAKDIVYVNNDVGNITFSHEIHTSMYSCDECHPHLFEPNRGANQASMEEMEAGRVCGACHDGDTAFSVAENCEVCHGM